MKSKSHRRQRSTPRARRRSARTGFTYLPVQSKSIRIPSASSRAALEFRSVTQSVDEAIVITDARGTIIFWNEGAETIFGYAEKEILGKPLALLIPMQSNALREGKLEHILFSKAAPIDRKTHELRGVRKDGGRFPVELSLLTWSFGEKVFFTTIIRDITERKHLQKEILEISGREQQRIGQDLHDDLCQQLTAITLLSEVLEKKLSDKSVAEAADAAEIHKLIAQAIAQTRLLAKGLLPVAVTADGLRAALDDMAAHTETLAQNVTCYAEDGPPVLIRDGTVAVHLYRIAQEAIANAIKHARAKHIVIKLLEINGQVILSITDDGIGIAQGAINNGGLGLSIMNSRAETINAALQIRRGDTGGTVVTCSLRAPAAPLVKLNLWVTLGKDLMATLLPRKLKKGKYKIFIADDHPLLREGLTRLINLQTDMMVCGEAPTAHDALKAIPVLKPDIVILDITLAESNGLDLIKDMKSRSIKTPILVLSMHDESLYAERALRAGAKGYIMKQEASKEVLKAIHHILAGEIYLSEKMAAKMLHKVAEGKTEAKTLPEGALSDRELQVFQSIGQGRGTRQIAEELHISAKTVESYRAHIKVKMNLKNAHELTQHAVHWVESNHLN